MGYIPFPPEQIMFGLTMFIVPYKVSVILLKIGDPYIHVERALRPMLFKKRKRTAGEGQSGKKEATKDQKKKNNDKDSKKKAEWMFPEDSSPSCCELYRMFDESWCGLFLEGMFRDFYQSVLFEV